VDPRRQEAAHAHSIIAAPGNRVVLVADLGMDKIMLYRLDGKTGALAPHDPPFIAARPGAGPRHQVFHPSGRFLYVVNELDSTVAVLAWDSARARGQEVQAISTLPRGYISPNNCAEISISPSGKFVYASNRGHDSLAIFAVDAANGKLAAAGHVFTQGKTPRNFELTPTGDVLLAANQDSDTIVPFWVDQATGQLTPTGNVTSVPTPVCVRMMATP
jgi:6-phosphogluconolactonase